ncbi:Fur-regulated basic protein FbpA [Salipaludibacillus agaradhaerens]|uniref:Fur-regulated basic protein FbpA n=1 Tax=Salipaludibacillus agaradhaerens TaxID=76935 RepID=A0A9Q4B439_SALAG|nr:hypothetical protein [Salipaludibacillus agaradhaerens]MCR6097972.1 Fur-regulated basic protein FbpA [Salipaludibacillus agaradhaerens]MCR6116399.1 Fur-regulated basic protein FbpA [Salipaludibacillus agaradhaerens]
MSKYLQEAIKKRKEFIITRLVQFHGDEDSQPDTRDLSRLTLTELEDKYAYIRGNKDDEEEMPH